MPNSVVFNPENNRLDKEGQRSPNWCIEPGTKKHVNVHNGNILLQAHKFPYYNS